MKSNRKWALIVLSLFALSTNANEGVNADDVNTVVVEVLGQVIPTQAINPDESAASDGVAGNDKAANQQAEINAPVTDSNKKSTDAKNEEADTSKVTLFTIGSGSVGGNYFTLGEVIGTVISHPIGSLPCGKGGTCGVVGLQSVNMATVGSVQNLRKLDEGTIYTGFVQSGIAYWAYTATGPFDKKEKKNNLRAIASLYPELIHVVVRKDLQAKSVADLRDKRVSVGTRHSGTLNSARAVLAAYNLSEDDMQTEYLNITETMQKMQNNELDAFFITMGVPAPFLTSLFNGSTEDGEEGISRYTVLDISGSDREKILQTGHYFSPAKIPAGVYNGVPEINTVSMDALWLTTADADAELIYNVTKALWNDHSRLLLDAFPVGKNIRIESSLNGIGIPLHEGAKKYYNEVGKRF